MHANFLRHYFPRREIQPRDIQARGLLYFILFYSSYQILLGVRHVTRLPRRDKMRNITERNTFDISCYARNTHIRTIFDQQFTACSALEKRPFKKPVQDWNRTRAG